MTVCCKSRRTPRPLTYWAATLTTILCLGLISPPASSQTPYLVRDLVPTDEPLYYNGCPLSPCPPPEPFFGAALTYFAEVNDLLFFVADDHNHGPEPWISDGSFAGTRPLADLIPGPEGSYPIPLGNLGEKLLFWARQDSSEWRLVSTDGSHSSISEISLPCGTHCLPSTATGISAEATLFFSVYDTNLRAGAIYATDGLGSRTVLDLCSSETHCYRGAREMLIWDDDLVIVEGEFDVVTRRVWKVSQPITEPKEILLECNSVRQVTSFHNEIYFLGRCNDGPEALYSLDRSENSSRLVHDFGTPIHEILANEEWLYLSVGLHPSQGRLLFRTQGLETSMQPLGGV